MADDRPPTGPIATGWLLALAWIFVVLLGLSILVTLTALVFGPDLFARTIGIPLQVPAFGIWDAVRTAVNAGFAIACVGVVRQDRDFASFAVVLAWMVVAVQCVDAFVRIFHLTLSIPIGALFYVAFALKLSSNLRHAPAPPPGSAGML
jgi:hypothetical protein